MTKKVSKHDNGNIILVDKPIDEVKISTDTKMQI